MRQQKTDILITTTILERGVTFDAVSVIVYGANHRVFTSSTLVQIVLESIEDKNSITAKFYFYMMGKQET